MIVLSVDVETSGLNPKSAKIIEIGAVLWDTERSVPLDVFSRIVDISPNLVDPVTASISGISNDDIVKYGYPLKSCIEQFDQMLCKASALLGHNIIEFDLKFIEAAYKQVGLSVKKVPIVDTMFDLPASDKVKSRKLNYLAADHGFLNPFSHRAVFDALTAVKIMSAYDFDEIWNISCTPLVIVEAKISFEDRGLAQSLGFSWNPKDKVWKKMMRRGVAEKTNFPFSFEMTVLFGDEER